MKKYILISILLISNAIAYSQERGMSQTTIKDTGINTGKTYAVIVGISNYKYITPLSFADQDALLFKEFLQSKAGGSLKDDNILLLINDDAKASTHPRIRHWISDLKKPQKGDKVYFYFAGHGDAIDGDEYFFLLQDCNPAGDKNNYIGGMASVLQMYNIKSYIKNSLTNKGVQVVMIWDACRTNELPGGAEGMKNAQQGIAEKTSGELVMLSASAGETAIENNSYAHGHGLFTYYLIDGLSGAADNADLGGNGDGKIDVAELETYAKMQVRKDAKNKFKSNQNPKFIYNTDMPIALVDEQFKQAWAMQKQSNDTYAYNAPKATRTAGAAMDTMVTNLYNQIMQAIKLDSIEGDNGAEALLKKMENKYPTNSLTQEAGFNLAMEYINLAQDKINLYLAGKDDTYFELNENGMFNDRIKQAAKRTNTANADFLKKAISLLKQNGEEDAIYLKQLEAKQNFFLARSFCKKEGKIRIFEEASDYAKKALQAQPNAAYNYNVMYILFYQTNKKDSALLYIKKAISLAPNWTYALCNIGIGFSDLYQYDSAKWYFKKAISIDPKLDNVYFGLGNIFFNLHQYDSAKWYYNKSISIDPKNAEEYCGLGNIFLNLHQYDSAKWYYNKAILLNPNSAADAYASMGDLFLVVLHQYDSVALKYLKQAIAINPKHIGALYDLACLYSVKKETKQALYYYELALQNGYNNLAHIKEDTDLDNIRNTEKFKELIKKYFPNQ